MIKDNYRHCSPDTDFSVLETDLSYRETSGGTQYRKQSPISEQHQTPSENTIQSFIQIYNVS